MSQYLATVLTQRRNVPDVPEDIDDVMDHLNDPNWDYRPPSPTLSTESIDLDRKEKGFISSRHSGSDFETESNAESSFGKTAASSDYGRTTTSKSQLWSSGASDLDEYVTCQLILHYYSLTSSATHLTLKYVPPSLASMTRQCQSTHSGRKLASASNRDMF